MVIRIKPRPAFDNKDILSQDEAMLYMGVSFRTLKAIMKTGELPFRKVGKRYLLSRKAIQDWLAFKPGKDNK